MLILPDDCPFVEEHGDDGANFALDMMSGGTLNSGGTRLKILLSRHQLLCLIERGRRAYDEAAKRSRKEQAERHRARVIPIRSNLGRRK